MTDAGRLDTVNKESICWRYRPTLGGRLSGNVFGLYDKVHRLTGGPTVIAPEVLLSNWSIIVRLAYGKYSDDIRYAYSSLFSIDAHGSWGAPLTLSFKDGLVVELNSARPQLRAFKLWENLALEAIRVCGMQSDIQKAFDLISSIKVDSLRLPDDFSPTYTTDFHFFRFSPNRPPSLDEGYIRNYASKYFKTLEEPSALHSPVKDPSSAQAVSTSVNGSICLKPQSDSHSTASAIKAGSLSVVADTTPQFQPSIASIPNGFESAGSHEADLLLCLASNALDIQSFFNDLNIFDSQNSIFVSDDILSLPCFDESLYCNIVKQMHRYTLAELADNKDQLAKENAGLGAMVGSLVGLMTGNIFAPFLGHSVGKNLTDQGAKISDFLPDPLLLFYQDINSYLSWSRGQVSSPKLRRLILDRQTNHDGTVFFRAIPAFVTADSIFPIQLFKSGDSTYFYRPFSAGIERNQVNYDATKIQRKYFHTRLDGEISRSDIMISIRGSDIEPSEQNVYRFTGPSLDYFYVDFQIQPGFVF